jgi:uncharacterized membrane protein
LTVVAPPLAGESGGRADDTVAGSVASTLVDGLFDAATWLLVTAATLLIIRAWQRGELAPPWRVHLGMLRAGWGVSNLVEGLIDHQLFGIHQVRMTSAPRSPARLPRVRGCCSRPASP